MLKVDQIVVSSVVQAELGSMLWMFLRVCVTLFRKSNGREKY